MPHPDRTDIAWLVVALVTVWGIRLSAHLARRNLGMGEDFRYARMRARFGTSFPVFGDACVWWSLWLLAASAGARWTIVGPIVMTILLRVSGKDLLERTIGERRPGYADYASRTSGFLPLPPKRS